MMYARQRGTSDMVHILIQAGADPVDQREVHNSQKYSNTMYMSLDVHACVYELY